MKYRIPRTGLFKLLVLAAWSTPKIVCQGTADISQNRGEAGPFMVSHDAPAPAQDLLNRKYLFGNRSGERARLENKGVKLDLYYTDDALANSTGGPEDAALWGRIRGTVDVDFSKFTEWEELTFHITGVWQYGTDLSKQYTGTLVDSTSLPSAHTLRLDSYWLQQYALHHKLVVRIGQIAAYDTYGNSEYGASYINLVMGYAHSNLNQAVIFAFNPAGVPSFEIKARPTEHVYVQAMVQSGERNPYSIDSNALDFHLGGPILATEIGYLKNPPKNVETTNQVAEPSLTDRQRGLYQATYKFGAGYNPHKFLDPLTHVSSPGNHLLYGQVAQVVY